MKLMKFALTASSLAVLVACGGGSTESNTNIDTDATEKITVLSGKVIDGYVQGALVCLDTNANLKCDESSIDPQAITSGDGSYSFEYTGDTAGMQVIAEVPVGAIDSDLGEVRQPYSMLAPATSASVVTPLTTLVSSEMLSSRVSAAQAEATVKANLNLSSSLVGYDFIQAKDANTTAVAQVTAAAIAQTTNEIKENILVIEAGLTSGQVIQRAVEQVKNSILPQLLSSTGSIEVADSSSQEAVIAQISTVVTYVISGQIQNIVASTKSGDGSVIDMAAVLGGPGVILANKENGQYIDAQEALKQFNDALQVEWITLDSQMMLRGFLRVLVDGVWFNKSNYSDDEIIFDGEAWVQQNLEALATSIVNGNCIEVPLVAGGLVTEAYCAVGKDISGKKISEINPEICKQGGNAIQNCNLSTVFPFGSMGYDLTITNKQDIYSINYSSSWSGYQTIGTNDIAGFIAYTKQSPQFTGNNCLVAFKIKSYDEFAIPKATTGVVEWGLNTSGGCASPSVAYSESTAFEIITVGGKNLIKIAAPNIFRANNMGDGDAYVIFGAHEGGVWSGGFSPASFKRSILFTGDIEQGGQMMSPVLFDFIQNQRGMTAFPYPQSQ